MLPKGRIPPKITLTSGCKYHFFSGIDRGTGLTRQGLSARPFQFLPTIVPTIVSGSDIKTQINDIMILYIKLELMIK